MLDFKDIPKGWTRTTLGKIISISSGKGLVKAKQVINGGYAVYGGNGVTGSHNEYLFEDKQIIIGRVGVHCGNVHITDSKSWITDNAFIVDFDREKLATNFLYYLLKVLNLNKYSSFTAQPVISQRNVYPIAAFIPPLSEQQEIVSKIEELFSELDKGKEQLETALQQLKVYRQAVLKWAFEGRFTNSEVKDGELSEGWKRHSLGNFITKIEAGKSFKCEERPPRESEIGIVKVSSVTWGEFDQEESKTIFSNDQFNKNYLIQSGDFLFSRANTIDLVGSCVIVKNISKQLMLSDKILRFNFNEDILKEYVLHFLRTKEGRREIESNSTGNQESMRNIGQQRIKQINIPVSTLEEQYKIVQEIESRLSVCDKVEETITKGMQQAETLRQSILKKAFEGKL